MALTVTSNQDGPYKDLESTVEKYATTVYRRPIADHTREAFAQAEAFVEQFYNNIRNTEGSVREVHSEKPRQADPFIVILDSGCGTGDSTLQLAKRFPDLPVIGIDKSAVRLVKANDKTRNSDAGLPANACWVRAELLDFWRLAADRVHERRWFVAFHALFYPNPWPKQSEATRRFHLHPIFPTLLQLSPRLELRTNWEIYAREFAAAAELCTKKAGTRTCGNLQSIHCDTFIPDEPISAFERKYHEAGQKLWKVSLQFSSCRPAS